MYCNGSLRISAIRNIGIGAEWFDSLEMYWHDVMKGGHLKNRFYPSIRGNDRTPYVLDGEEHATLAAHCELEAGEKKKIRFILTWYFPNCANTWHPEPKAEAPVIWQNYYTKLTGSSKGLCGLWDQQLGQVVP